MTSAPRRPWWRTALRALAAGVVGGGAIWIVVSAAGGFDDALAAIEKIDVVWIVPAVLCEMLAYVLSGLRLRKLAGRPDDVTVLVATEVEFVVNGFGLLTPASPVEGLALGGHELSRRGLGTRRAALSLAMSEWFSLQAFLLVSALNLTWVVATRDFPVDTVWPLATAAAILVALVVSVVLASKPATVERLAVILGRLPIVRSRRSPAQQRDAGTRMHADVMQVVGTRADRAALVALSIGSLLADVACLHLLLIAAHAHVGFSVTVLAVGAGALASLIPFLPAGIGVTEAIIPAVVHWYGPPLSAALAGALAYRVIGTLLPAAIGALAVLTLRIRRKDATPATETA